MAAPFRSGLIKPAYRKSLHSMESERENRTFHGHPGVLFAFVATSGGKPGEISVHGLYLHSPRPCRMARGEDL